MKHSAWKVPFVNCEDSSFKVWYLLLQIRLIPNRKMFKHCTKLGKLWHHCTGILILDENIFLTCYWRFQLPWYNTLEQLECQLEQIIGMYNLETYKNMLGNTRKNKEI